MIIFIVKLILGFNALIILGLLILWLLDYVGLIEIED